MRPYPVYQTSISRLFLRWWCPNNLLTHADGTLERSRLHEYSDRRRDFTISRSRRWLTNLQLDTEALLGVLGLRWFPLAFPFFARQGCIKVALSSNQASTYNVTCTLLVIHVTFPPRPSMLRISPGLRSAPSFEPSLIFFDCDNEGIRVFFSVSQ